jgi:flagellar basal body-associated protein FliL
MLIELLTLKLTFDAILQHCNNLAYQQELRERVAILKNELLESLTAYELGQLSPDQYEKKESEIITELNKLTRLIQNAGSLGDVTTEGSSSPSIGLGLL